MSTDAVFTPYSTVVPLVETLPTWVPEVDRERVGAYQKYEEIYWNHPEAFALLFREESDGDEDAVYVPNGRILVNTLNRYVGSRFNWWVDPEWGNEQEQSIVAALFEAFWIREEFKAKFRANKLYGIMKGDWCWHLIADPNKPPGERVSIYELDPGTYFPILDPNNLDRRVGCHIAEPTTNEAGDPVIRRLTYRKDAERNGVITVEEALFELEDWDLEETAPVEVIRPLEDLPAQITALPVYHVKTHRQPGNPFGSSLMRGVEMLLAAVNRTLSDEDVALAMEALGFYATDASEPRDEQGNPVGWKIGPARVVRFPVGGKFERVQGITSIQPYQDHISYMEAKALEAAGANSAARGEVDVNVAESGIALALRLAPTLQLAEEADEELLTTHQQMFYDMVAWFTAYEGVALTLVDDPAGNKAVGRVRIRPEVDADKGLPTNRASRFQELLEMLKQGIIDPDFFRTEAASRFGYTFPADIGTRAEAYQSSQMALAASAIDPAGDRAGAELEDQG